MEIDMHFKPAPFSYIKTAYKVPAEIGREIIFDGKRKGIIVEDMGNYIGVNFYDEKSTKVSPLHPTSGVEYLGMSKPRKLTASQKRYKEFVSLDLGCTYKEYLGIKKCRIAERPAE